MAFNPDNYNQQMAQIQGQIEALKANPYPPPPTHYEHEPPPPPSPKHITKVKGINGAIKYQNDLPPGSDDVVFDEDTDHFYLVEKYENGATPVKIRCFRFTFEEDIETTPVYITKSDFDKFKEEIRMLLTKEKATDE